MYIECTDGTWTVCVNVGTVDHVDNGTRAYDKQLLIMVIDNFPYIEAAHNNTVLDYPENRIDRPYFRKFEKRGRR